MALAALSYPLMSGSDEERIRSFRAQYDELFYRVVDAHITFVFPVEESDEQAFIADILQKVKGWKAFEVEFRSALVNRDPFLGCYHLLLAPDKGFAEVVKLHDRLYTGRLYSFRRLDIDFIPHMGIGSSIDPEKVRAWAAEWNSHDFCIPARIESLTIVDYDGKRVKDLSTVNLEK